MPTHTPTFAVLSIATVKYKTIMHLEVPPHIHPQLEMPTHTPTFAVVSIAIVMAPVKIQDCPRLRKARVCEVLMAPSW
jgi:hypothetical protein